MTEGLRLGSVPFHVITNDRWLSGFPGSPPTCKEGEWASHHSLRAKNAALRVHCGLPVCAGMQSGQHIRPTMAPVQQACWKDSHLFKPWIGIRLGACDVGVVVLDKLDEFCELCWVHSTPARGAFIVGTGCCAGLPSLGPAIWVLLWLHGKNLFLTFECQLQLLCRPATVRIHASLRAGLLTTGGVDHWHAIRHACTCMLVSPHSCTILAENEAQKNVCACLLDRQAMGCTHHVSGYAAWLMVLIWIAREYR